MHLLVDEKPASITRAIAGLLRRERVVIILSSQPIVVAATQIVIGTTPRADNVTVFGTPISKGAPS